ncbi:MAG: ABC transporter substrate-binding protein [Litorivicinaceae bacterium]
MHVLAQLTLLVAALVWTLPSHAKPITVLLDWFVNPDHAPLIIALETGGFAKRGLEVRLIEPADPSLPPKLVAAGQADIAVSYQPSLMMDLANGLPLARIGALVDTPLNSLVVLENGPIQSIADLKGKTVGYSVGGFEDAILGAMLRTVGLSASDIRLVNVNFALSPSLYTGQVDAVIGAFRNFELNQMDLDGKPGRAFFPEQHGVPPYEELILVTRPERAQSPEFSAFLDALDEATQAILADPESTYRTFVGYKPAELDTPLNARAWRDTLPKLAKTARATEPAAWDRFAAFLNEAGLITERPNTADYLLSPP